MNLTTSREMRIWKIEWLNMARRRSDIRIDSDNDHGGIKVHTQAKIIDNRLATLARRK